jgi:catechol 2,3-dioxygenase-like lactoylglutathione lyase family enzyme
MTLLAPHIHHVQIAIPADSEQRARQFYGELLGLPEVDKPDALRACGGVWFSSGTLPLHLGVDGAFRPARQAHVAFAVEDLSAVRDRLVAAGSTVRDDASLPGYDRFYVADPYGNRIEILAPSGSRAED